MEEPVLRSDRLVLRPWVAADAERLVEIYSHDDVWPWLGAHPLPVDDVETARRRIERWGLLADGPLGLWAVECTGVAGVPSGVCGSVLLTTLPRSDGRHSDAIEIGWHLHPEAWRHGVAWEAAQLLLDRAAEAGYPRVHAVVRPDNERSKAVARRLGMSYLGRTDEWYGTELDDFCLLLEQRRSHQRSRVISLIDDTADETVA